jgi:hypothetical protein
MFQPRSTDFLDPRLSAIVKHLRAIEKELAKISSTATRGASANAGSQIADAIAAILDDIVNRFRHGQRAAIDGAADLGGEAVKAGSQALGQISGQVSGQAARRPLLTLTLAVGLGILIGIAAKRT